MRGLRAQGSFVEEVAKDAEGEDGYRKSIAAIACISAGKFGKYLIVVF